MTTKEMTTEEEQIYMCNECGTNGWGDERGEIDDDGDFTCEECIEKAEEEEEVYREFRKELAEEDSALIDYNYEDGIETEMKIQNRHLRWLLKMKDEEETRLLVEKKYKKSWEEKKA